VETSSLVEALPLLSSDRLRKRVRHVVTETYRVRQSVTALERDDFIELGRLFVISHESMRDDYEISCPELNQAVEGALSAGALGARMTGGGFGGSAIALVEAERADDVAATVTTRFAQAGFARPPRFITAWPSAPAGPVTRGNQT
jgi:galactokinase